MFKRLLVTAALGALTIASAYAADPPANAEQCHKLHSEIADAVTKVTIPANNKVGLDELFAKLKGHCEAAAFVEAGQTMAAIRETAGSRTENSPAIVTGHLREASPGP